MHPIFQLCVAVSLMVIAVRAWPPLAYVLLGVMALLLVVKVIRRGARAVSRNLSSAWFARVASFVVYVMAWLLVAFVADYFLPRKVSATSIVLCLSGAYMIVALVGAVVNKTEKHH